MPPALDEDVKERVWGMWLSGGTRKNIAEVCGIGSGSVTNIVNEQTRGLDSSEYSAIRELGVQLKKEGLTFADLSSMYRRHNYIEKMGANEEIEVLIANLIDKTKSIPTEKTADLVNQLYELSKSESIPPSGVPAYINQKIEEKQRLEEEIEKAHEILDQENFEIRALEEYKELREELKKRGISIENSRQFVSVLLQTIDRIGYDPRKVIRDLAHIKSLRQTVRGLSKACRKRESRAIQYKEVLPMCERVVSMGIGLPLLLALETGVIKKVELDGVPPGVAPYRVLQEIEDYNKFGGIKKQLYDASLQLNIMKEILGRQNDAVVALAKFRLYGITEDQILKMCRDIEVNGHNLNSSYMQSIIKESRKLIKPVVHESF